VLTYSITKNSINYINETAVPKCGSELNTIVIVYYATTPKSNVEDYKT